MHVGVVECSWFVAPGNRDVTFRSVGLALTAVALILAFLSPALARSRLRVGPAQMAAALYAVLSVLGIAVLGTAAALFIGKNRGDNLSVEGIFLLLALVLLLAGFLARSGALGMGARHLTAGFLLGWLTLICFAFDAVTLTYVWLAPRPSGATACGTMGSMNVGVLLMAGFTAIVALVAMRQPVSAFLRARRVPEIYGRIVLPAVVGAAIEVALVIMRGPEGWYTGSHLSGLDLMLANVVIGLGVFLFTLTRTRSTVPMHGAVLEEIP